MSARCLNCDEPLERAYCAHCGQAANTERFTVGGLGRDLAGRIFYLDSAIYETLRAFALRPGHVVRDYVRGHRARYFNPFGLLVVLALLDSTLRGYWGFHLASTDTDEASRQLLEAVEDVRLHHAKLLILATLPIRAGVSYAWFRRAGQNYAEHVVIEAWGAAASLGIAAVADGLAALLGERAGMPVVRASVLVASAYQLVLYVQYFSPFGYTRAGLWARSAVAVISVPLLVIAALAGWLALAG